MVTTFVGTPDEWQEYDCPASGIDFDLGTNPWAPLVQEGEAFPCSGCWGTHVATPELIRQYRQDLDGTVHFVPLRKPLPEVAVAFATRAHGAQIRRYTGEAYVNHCIAVASTVRSYLQETDGRGYRATVAALLHDVLEDTPTRRELISEVFGAQVLELVLEVTEASSRADGGRAQRKAIDRAHYGRASFEGKTIKLADLLDNLKSIAAHDPEFARVYVEEMLELLPLLQGGHPDLHARAVRAIDDAADELLLSFRTRKMK